MTKKLHKKSSAKKKVLKRVARSVVRFKKVAGHDAQFAEFESQDLGSAMRLSNSGQVISRKTKPTSLLLEEDLIEQLRLKGAKRGLGYQTMLKVIVRENMNRY